MNRSKVTAAGLKELAKLAPQVAADVDHLRKRYRTRRISYQAHPAGWQCYLAEGASYKFYPPNGKALATHMVSENTLGARNDGVNYHVGERTPAMPEGTWVVEFELFLGQPYINLHYIGQMALEAA